MLHQPSCSLLARCLQPRPAPSHALSLCAPTPPLPAFHSTVPSSESAAANPFTPVVPPSDPATEQALAWTGDAVLALFAREHVLARLGRIDTPAFLDLTSNAFLSTLGRPTRVEAEIGLVYRRDGLPAAFAYIESRILPLWRAQQARRARRRSG